MLATIDKSNSTEHPEAPCDKCGHSPCLCLYNRVQKVALVVCQSIHDGVLKMQASTIADMWSLQLQTASNIGRESSSDSCAVMQLQVAAGEVSRQLLPEDMHEEIIGYKGICGLPLH